MLLAAGCAERNGNQSQPGPSSPRIAPGLWEVRSAIVAARAPALPLVMRDRMIGPRPTRHICLTAAQAERADATFLAQRPGDCVQRGVSLAGGRLTGAMVCRERGLPPSVVALEGRYGPDRYVLRMEMTSPLPDGTVIALDVVTVGQRVGDCDRGGNR